LDQPVKLLACTLVNRLYPVGNTISLRERSQAKITSSDPFETASAVWRKKGHSCRQACAKLLKCFAAFLFAGAFKPRNTSNYRSISEAGNFKLDPCDVTRTCFRKRHF
jgi:hypothetical protein